MSLSLVSSQDYVQVSSFFTNSSLKLAISFLVSAFARLKVAVKLSRAALFSWRISRSSRSTSTSCRLPASPAMSSSSGSATVPRHSADRAQADDDLFSGAPASDSISSSRSRLRLSLRNKSFKELVLPRRSLCPCSNLVGRPLFLLSVLGWENPRPTQ